MYSDDVSLDVTLPYSDNTLFQELTDQVSHYVQDIGSALVRLEQFIANGDTASAVALADRTRAVVKEATKTFKKLESQHDVTPAQKFTQQKLHREFTSALKEFQDIQKELASKQRHAVAMAENRAFDAVGDHDGSSSHSKDLLAINEPSQQQQQQQLQQLQQEDSSQEWADQQALIQERELEIQGIEEGIQELNEIFTDLSAIVAEQGGLIDNIEANIYNVARNAQGASTELTRAARYQRNARGRCFCLLIILVVILLVVLLGIFI